MDKKFLGEGLSIKMGIGYGLTTLILLFLNIWILVLQPEQFFSCVRKFWETFEDSMHRHFRISFETDECNVYWEASEDRGMYD